MNDYEIGAKIGQAINIASQIAINKGLKTPDEIVNSVAADVNILVKGFDQIFKAEKHKILNHKKDIKDFISDIKKITTVEQFKDYQNENAMALKNLSKEDAQSLKDTCKQHFNIK